MLQLFPWEMRISRDEKDVTSMPEMSELCANPHKRVPLRRPAVGLDGSEQYPTRFSENNALVLWYVEFSHGCNDRAAAWPPKGLRHRNTPMPIVQMLRSHPLAGFFKAAKVV